MPIQGPASQRERDLGALLPGEAGYPAAVLGPVAGVLAALRAAPGPGELDGEAAARAAFRLFLPREAGLPGLTLLRQEAVAGQRGPDGQGSPGGLPPTASGGPRHARPRRRVPWHGRWQVMTVACGAAAAVIVGAVALAGGFSGPGGHRGPAGQRPSTPASADASSHRPASSVLGGGATTVPHARPTPAAASGQAASPETLCRQYMGFFTHPEPPADWPAENAVIQRLGGLAGGPLRIIGYCAGRSGAGAPGSHVGYRGGAGARVTGHPPDRDRFGEPVMPGLGQSRSGSSSGGR